MFIEPGTNVYEGMVIGAHNRENDLDVNVTKEKKLTNIRAAGRDENVILTPPRMHSIESAMEYIDVDELVEVVPDALRIRKTVLGPGRGVKRSASVDP
jgi:GTP-binding protein